MIYEVGDFFGFTAQQSSVRQIATRLKIHPRSVINTGHTLGIYFTPQKRERAAKQKMKET
jgi:hypothetical protein